MKKTNLLHSPKWEIDLLLHRSPRIWSPAQIKKLAQSIITEAISKMPAKAHPPQSVCHLSIVIVGDKAIHTLNRDFRGKNKPTDVLSFSQIEGESGEIDPVSLGDVVISIDTTRRQAKEYKVTVKAEFLRLLIHGILHLLGVDHEKVSKKRVKEMQKMEDELFVLLSES